MKTYRKILDQAIKKDLIIMYGYSGPIRGADNHYTYINNNDLELSLLIDIGGNEWHRILSGVVTNVGHLDDNSLEDFLIRGIVGEEKEKPYRPRDKGKELHKQDPEGIYQPDGGNYSGTSPSSMG